jgi:hypothetical protein
MPPRALAPPDAAINGGVFGLGNRTAIKLEFRLGGRRSPARRDSAPRVSTAELRRARETGEQGSRMRSANTAYGWDRPTRPANRAHGWDRPTRRTDGIGQHGRRTGGQRGRRTGAAKGGGEGGRPSKRSPHAPLVHAIDRPSCDFRATPEHRWTSPSGRRQQNDRILRKPAVRGEITNHQLGVPTDTAPLHAGNPVCATLFPRSRTPDLASLPACQPASLPACQPASLPAAESVRTRRPLYVSSAASSYMAEFLTEGSPSSGRNGTVASAP